MDRECLKLAVAPNKSIQHVDSSIKFHYNFTEVRYFGNAFDRRAGGRGRARVADCVPASVGAGALPRKCRRDSDRLTTDNRHSLPQVSLTQRLSNFCFPAVM